MSAIGRKIIGKTNNRLGLGPSALLLLLFLLGSSPCWSYDLDTHYKFEPAKAPDSPLTNTWSAFQTQLYTGSFGYEFTFALPPGTAGLTPKLSLSYNSGAAGGKPGWVGAGWEIPLSYIQRDIEYTRKDTSDDTFDLLLEGAKHDLVFTEADGRYHTKIESWLRVERLTGTENESKEYWLVTGRDGTQYRFGYNPDSDHLVEASDGAVPTYVWRWSLDQVTDPNGNLIFFSYDENPYPNDRGAVYLSSIVYNQNEHRRIDFISTGEDREDMYLTMDQGSETRISRLLKEVRISVDGALVRKYVLDYELNGAGTKSLLTSITQFGSDGTTALPPVTFTYKDPDPGFESETTWATPGERWIRKVDEDSDTIVDTIDTNGDGLVDLVSFDGDHWDIWLSDGAGFAANNLIWGVDPGWAIRQVNTYANNGESPDTKSSPMDINRDGYPDFLYAAESTELQIRFNNSGTGFGGITTWGLPIRVSIQEVENPSTSAPNVYQEFFDINGDGLPDLVERQDGGWHVWRNTGSGFTEYGTWPVPHSSRYLWDYTRDVPNLEIGHFDMNGDGLDDIVDSADGNWHIYFNTGSEFLPEEVWSTGYSGLIRDPDTTGNVKRDLFDINGDGLPDIVNPPSGSSVWEVRLNTGHGFAEVSDWPAPATIPADGFTRDVTTDGHVRRDVFDIDGDGAVDVVRKTSSNWMVARNRSGPADLLVGIRDTLGGSIEVDYGPSRAYENTRLPSNFWVVTALTKDNGMTGPHAQRAATHYVYSGGLYDFPTREFRGFSQVTETRADGSIVVHHFHQDEGRKGKESLTETKAADDSLLAAVDNTWASSQSSGVYETLLTQTDERAHDGVAENPKVKRTELADYDEYGNLLLEIRQGDLAVTGDESRHYSEFTVNPERWIIDKQSHTWVTDGAGTKLREQWLYYDGAGGTSVPPVKGNLTREVRWLDTGPNPEWRYEYDGYGNRTSTLDPEGRLSGVEYDPLYHSFPVKLTNAKGQETTRTYDPASGEILSETDPNGYTTSYEYDLFQRRIKEIRPYDSPTLPTVETEYLLNGSAPEEVVTRKREVSGTAGTLESFQFVDGLGNLIQQKTEAEDPAQQIVADHYYDNLWRVARQSNPYLAATVAGYSFPAGSEPATLYGYDGLGRPTLVQNPDGTQRTRAFDHWTVTETDENGHAKTYVFDYAQRPLEVVEHVAAEDYQTNYLYDPLGKLVQVTDHPGNVTQVTYDSLGRKTTLDDPDLGLWTYGYDRVSNLTAQTDARGITTHYSYDALDRKVREDFPNGSDVVYAYDQGTVGTLSTVTDAAGEVAYIYDARLRKVSETRRLDGYAWTTEWDYDSLDRPIRQVYPNGEVAEYVYNGQGLLDAIPGVVPNLDYNAAGLMTLKEYANGIDTSYSYDPQNQRLTAIHAEGDTGTLVQDLSYGYDAVGNVLSIADGVAGDTEHFTYDDLDRLITAGDSGYAFTYTYNAVGNLLDVDEDGFPVTYGYGDGAGPHAVTSMTAREPRIGSFVVHYGDEYSLARDVPLNAVIFGEATEYLASELEDFSDAVWKPLNKTPLFTLSTGFGPKTVYYKVRNAERESEAKLDGIWFAPDLNGDGVPDHLLVDSDEDGMPDDWEIGHGFDPNDPSDGAEDTDGDGLTNAEEARLGTNPRLKDSDGDGINDGDEVNTGTDPTNKDTDGDGLDDGEDPQPLYDQNPPASENYALRLAQLDSGGGRRAGAQFGTAKDRIGLFGVGFVQAPSLVVTPAWYDFGKQVLGGTSSSQGFSIRNSGTQAAPVGNLGVTGNDSTDFQLQADACSGLTLGAGESCAFEVTFDALYVGEKSAVVVASIGSGADRAMVALLGEASDLDSDGDGLPDAYEKAHGLDPYDPSDALLDSDGDGYDNKTEFEAGSDPNDDQSTPQTLKLVLSRESLIVPEGGQTTIGIKLSQQPTNTVRVDVVRTDGDADIAVVSSGTLWLTAENWDQYQNVVIGAEADADNENGIAQLTASAQWLEPRTFTATEQEPIAVRMQRGAFNAGAGLRSGGVYAVSDTLGNLLPDRVIVGADPDSDGDGIPDSEDPDDDNDGLEDQDEIDSYGTDPLVPDTDGDGLGDGTEAGVAGFDADPTTATDPLNPDSDGDGYLDGNNGVDPCEDCDNNGSVDPGETDPFAPNAFVHLIAGLNLFSYPDEVPLDHSTCDGLAEALGGPGVIAGVARLNPDTGLLEECDAGAGTVFPIEMGEAYVIQAKTNISMVLPWSSACPTRTLDPGLNLVGHPAPLDLTCFTWLAAQAPGTVTSIQGYDPSSGRFETCAFFEREGNDPQAVGVDFPIRAAQGYLLSALGSTSVVFPGCP